MTTLRRRSLIAVSSRAVARIQYRSSGRTVQSLRLKETNLEHCIRYEVKRTKEYLAVASLLMVFVPGSAQRAATQSEGRYGSIEGVVVTAEGIPVSGASVYLFQPGGSPLTATNEATLRFQWI